MSFLNIKNVKVRGIAACVPSRIEENRDYTRLSHEEIEKYIQTTGVERSTVLYMMGQYAPLIYARKQQKN